MLAYLDTIVDESDPDTDLSQVECRLQYDLCPYSISSSLSILHFLTKTPCLCVAGTRSADCRVCASRLSRRRVRLAPRRGADSRFGKSDERQGRRPQFTGRASVGRCGTLMHSLFLSLSVADGLLHAVYHGDCGGIITFSIGNDI